MQHFQPRQPTEETHYELVFRLEDGQGSAFAGAVKKGYEAADTGAAKETNPYNALASCRGGATFARAFHKYWNLGYDSYGEGSET